MFVEDAVSAQGPIIVEVNPAITVADLKLQIETEFEIPVNVQKWILGKNLVSEDTITLHSQGIDVDGAQIFLYLVNPGEYFIQNGMKDMTYFIGIFKLSSVSGTLRLSKHTSNLKFEISNFLSI